MPFLLTLLVILSPDQCLQAQSVDPDTVALQDDYFDVFRLTPASAQLFNDSLNFLSHDPVRFDKALRNEVFLQQTGNMGSAINDILAPKNSKGFITDGFDQFDRHFIDVATHDIDIPGTRFTNIDYHLASKKEQHIYVTHNQKFRPWIVAGVEFGAQISPGEFTGQEKNGLNLRVFSLASTRNRKYNVYASYVSNRMLNDENGGVVDDSLFINADKLQTKTQEVNMNNATMRIKNREYYLRHEFIPSATEVVDGSPKVGIRHTFQWFRQSVLYQDQDPNPEYFTYYFNDSTASYDSSFTNSVLNSGEVFIRKGSGSSMFEMSAGVEYQEMDYYTGMLEKYYNSTSAIATAQFNFNGIASGIEWKLGLDGSQQGANEVKLRSQYNTVNYGSIMLDLGYRKAQPALRDLVYNSNHFQWDNSGGADETRMYYQVEWHFKKYNSVLHVKGIMNKDFIYYQSDQLPQRYNEYAGATEFSLRNFIHIGKLGLENGISYYVTSEKKVMPLPDLAFREQIYFKSLIFKGAVNFRSGFIFRYNTGYKASTYMPATGVFYVQEQTRIGDYLYIDYFMKFGIKTATLFIMVEHLNAGLGDRNYFMTPNYPMPSRAFKFGLSWNFFD